MEDRLKEFWSDDYWKGDFRLSRSQGKSTVRGMISVFDNHFEWRCYKCYMNRQTSIPSDFRDYDRGKSRSIRNWVPSSAICIERASGRIIWSFSKIIPTLYKYLIGTGAQSWNCAQYILPNKCRLLETTLICMCTMRHLGVVEGPFDGRILRIWNLE